MGNSASFKAIRRSQSEKNEQLGKDLLKKTQALEDINQKLKGLIQKTPSEEKCNNSTDATDNRKSAASVVISKSTSYLPSFSLFSSSTSKFSMILKKASQQNILTDIKSDSPVLILVNEEYHFFGFSNGEWKITILDADIISPLNLPFPTTDGEVILEYDRLYKPLFKNI